MFTTFFPSDQLYLVIACLVCVSTWSVILFTQVPWSRWFGVVVPQQTFSGLNLRSDVLTWLSISLMACVGDTCLDSYPPRHPCDAKGPNRLQIQGRNSLLTSVSFSSNNCVPGPPRSLSSSASSSSGVVILIIVSDFGFLVGESQFCCRHLQRLTLCSPLLVFHVFEYPCPCQYLWWRNCHALLHQDSTVIEIAIPLSPHLEIVTRRSSAHQKH